MFLALLLLVSSLVPTGFSSAAHAAPSTTATYRDGFVTCKIQQQGVEWVEFRANPTSQQMTVVTVAWANGSESSVILERDLSDWAVSGFVLSLLSPNGRKLDLQVRSEEGVLLGFFNGSDGSPFPVSCVTRQ